MKKDSTSITVSIDLSDEFEAKLLEHVKRKGNRSKYLKRLIYDDMTGVSKIDRVFTVEDEEKPTDDDIKGFF